MQHFLQCGAAALALGATLAGCGASSSTDHAPDLNGTSWVLSSMAGRPLQGTAVPTARFEAGRVQGSDGCNRYSVPYSVTGAAIRVEAQGASTRMACPPEVTAQADAFMDALSRAGGYRVTDGRLDLLSSEGVVLASFTRQAQELAGSSWRVTGYNNGRQAVVSTLSGTNLTMAFSSEGTVAGSAGCNTYSAAYTYDGRKLTVGPAAATRKMCANPPGIMEQEQQFLKALETASTVRMEGNQLELRNDQGALMLRLAREV